MIAAVGEPLDHVALLYQDAREYVHGIRSFLAPALADSAPVLIAVPDDRLALLREALAGVGPQIRYADMRAAGRNPGRILPSVLLPFAARHQGRRAWIVGEPVWPGRTETEYPACLAHEALINAAFAGRDAAILCPYDAAGLDATTVADAGRTHPTFLTDDAGRRPSGAYTAPFAVAAECNLPLPAVPGHAESLRYDREAALGEVRRFVAANAHRAGLDADRTDDLVLAVNELAANTIEHSPGPGWVRWWAEPGQVIYQVEDSGHLDDPLAGRIPPAGDVTGGRGLILVHQLCDLVRIHTGPSGTDIRLFLSVPPERASRASVTSPASPARQLGGAAPAGRTPTPTAP
ncbi:anti-sigma factor RsbA family regulatory protein [Pilimelia columellifera subsp. columellifera]|uniref:Anti-sigma factor RsbA family regulatory protein n=1 Tax=Pilimelia columellifera subsp. columellifera TaxID=706583 RepID=A0ABN3N8J7_9ACTN